MAQRDVVPLIDAQTANILGSVNNYMVQQHVKWWDNCVEAPNTYTIYNADTGLPLIRVEEQSECMTRCCCAPHHGVVLQFNALGPDGNPLFPGRTTGVAPRAGRLFFKVHPIP